MFYNSEFNSDISGWDVSKVTTMSVPHTAVLTQPNHVVPSDVLCY